jgi:hypothetical protein
MRNALIKITRLIEPYTHVLLVILIGSVVLGAAADIMFSTWKYIDDQKYVLVISSAIALVFASMAVGYYIFRNKKLHGWTKVGWCSTLGALLVTNTYNYAIIFDVIHYSPFSLESLVSSHLMAFGIIMSVFGHSKGRGG